MLQAVVACQSRRSRSISALISKGASGLEGRSRRRSRVALGPSTMTTQNHYTFGDDRRAAERLALLAQAYEAPSRALLARFSPRPLELAFDLGSGIGHTTRLVHEVSGASRTVGLEASERYLALARSHAPPGVEFVQADVTAPSRAQPRARLVFCRFLLTHVAEPARAIEAFGAFVEPGGVLLLQETAELEASHPALRRYYELVGALQAHYGQKLYIGRELERLAAGTAFRVQHFAVQRFERPAPSMAEIHLPNLRTWRRDPYARAHFDPAELDRLEHELAAIAVGKEPALPVRLGLGELALVAPAG